MGKQTNNWVSWLYSDQIRFLFLAVFWQCNSLLEWTVYGIELGRHIVHSHNTRLWWQGRHYLKSITYYRNQNTILEKSILSLVDYVTDHQQIKVSSHGLLSSYLVVPFDRLARQLVGWLNSRWLSYEVDSLCVLSFQNQKLNKSNNLQPLCYPPCRWWVVGHH